MISNQDIANNSPQKFDPNSEIANTENLYRAVRSNPNYWKEKFNRISTAALKDKRGLSVDRDGDRKQYEVIQSFQDRKWEGYLLYVQAKICKDIGTYLKPSPSHINNYHALILENENDIELSDEKCDKLCKEFVRISELSKGNE